MICIVGSKKFNSNIVHAEAEFCSAGLMAPNIGCMTGDQVSSHGLPIVLPIDHMLIGLIVLARTFPFVSYNLYAFLCMNK